MCKLSCKEIKFVGNECELNYNNQKPIVIDFNKLSEEIHLLSSTLSTIMLLNNMNTNYLISNNHPMRKVTYCFVKVNKAKG